MDARVRYLVHEMEARLGCRLAASELAGEVGLSVAQVTRLFLRDTGLTTRAYLQRLRMSRARWLLEHTSFSIAQIMTAVGMSDRKHFARGFRLAHGATPRALRMQLRSAARTAASKDASKDAKHGYGPA